MHSTLSAAGERTPYRRHQLTVDDFRKLGIAGVLKPDARVELLTGELIDMAPIGSRHAGIVAQLAALFSDAHPRALVWVQNPLSLPPDSEPQPDLMLLVPRDDYYKSAAPAARDVLLLVEVADTTLAYDRDIKLPVYARHGIVEVWIVDVAGGRVERYEAPAADGYRASTVLQPGDRAVARHVPGIDIDIGVLF